MTLHLALLTCAVALATACASDSASNNSDGGGVGARAGAGMAPVAGMSGNSAAAGRASGGGAGTGDAGSGGAVASSAGAPSDGGNANGAGAGGAGALSGGGTGGPTASAGIGGTSGSGKQPCPAGPFPTPAVQSTKSVCTNFAFNYNFNEGATWIPSQNAFFFTNFVVRAASGGDIIKYTPGGSCEIFIRDVGCNGLALSNDGNLLAACHQSRSVIRFDLATKQPTTLASSYMGMLLDTPNDLVMHSNGTIYFTNPTYELAGRPAGVGFAVFRIDPTGMLSLVARSSCNGIGLSPDERKLYVLQAGVWDLDDAGVPSNRAELFTGGDGMAVDCAGNLYASGNISSASGQRLGQYGSGTNLAFGGVDGKTVLVVGGGTQVRELQMNVPGLP